MSQRNDVDLMEMFAMRATEMSELVRQDMRFYGSALSVGGKRIAPWDYKIDIDGAIIWPLENNGHVGMPCLHERVTHPALTVDKELACTYAVTLEKPTFLTARSPGKTSLEEHAELRRYCLADVPGKTLKLNPVPRTCLDAVGFTAR